MTTKELIELLGKYPETTEVGFLVEYTDHNNCGRNNDGYCYCESEEHKLDTIQLRHEESFTVMAGQKSKVLTRLWICGE